MMLDWQEVDVNAEWMKVSAWSGGSASSASSPKVKEWGEEKNFFFKIDWLTQSCLIVSQGLSYGTQDHGLG